LYAGYRFVDSKFRLADRRAQQADALARRDELSRAVVRVILGELRSNHTALRNWVGIFVDHQVPHLPLRTNGAHLLFEPVALEALPRGVASSLISIYGSTDELNRDLARLAELHEADMGPDRSKGEQMLYDHVRAKMDSLTSNLAAAAAALGAPIDDDED
jgi:hypothetical protein